MKKNTLYDVIDFSEKIIQKASAMNLSVSNLQLQKILYYLQGNYLAKLGRKAFDESIECWEYGPVVRRAWEVFSVYGRSPILDLGSNLNLSQEEEKIFDDVLPLCLKMNVWDLVEKTHKELPWKKAHDSKKEYLDDGDLLFFFKNK